MELTQMKQLAAVAQYESVSQAARCLHISQPALSSAIRKCEKELDVRLFERLPGRMKLSEAGELIIQHIQIILEQEERMLQDLEAWKKQGSLFRVLFCDPGPMWYMTPKSALIPGLEVAAQTMKEGGDPVTLLESREADLVICDHCVLDARISSRRLIRDEVLLSLPPDFLSRSLISDLSDLSALGSVDFDWIASHVSLMARLELPGAFSRKSRQIYENLEPRIRMEWFSDYFSFRQYLMAHPQAATTTTSLVKTYRDDGQGRLLIPLCEPGLHIDYWACWLKSRQDQLEPLMHWLDLMEIC